LTIWGNSGEILLIVLEKWLEKKIERFGFVKS